MAAALRENKRRKARYRCRRSGIDKLEVTVYLTEEFIGGSLSSTISAVGRAMRDMNLSRRGTHKRHREARACWASKDDTVTVNLERNGFETRLRFLSSGAVARDDDSLGYYRRFRDVLDCHGIAICGEQIKELHLAIDLPPDVFETILQYRNNGKYGGIRSTPTYEQSDEESIRFGSKDLTHIYAYYKVFADQPDVCRIEFRVKRNILERCHIKTISDLGDPDKIPKLEECLKKVFRLTTVNPRKAKHHTEVKTARLWVQVENHLSTLLGQITQEHVPESPPERKITMKEIAGHARSIDGSLVSLCRFCNDHVDQVPLPESLARVEATARLAAVTLAILLSGSPKPGTPSPWDVALAANHPLTPLSRERFDALIQLRRDIARRRIDALRSRMVHDNEHKADLLCAVELRRAEHDLQRLEEVFYIDSTA